MVEAELVLPVAVGNPEIDEVGVLRSPYCLAGVEGQTDRLAVELNCGAGAERTRTEAGEWIVLVTLLAVPGSAAADREILHVLRQEAEIHVVVGFDRPGRIEAGIAVRKTGCAGG